MQGSFREMDPKRDNRFETKSSHKSAKAQRNGRESRKHENTKKTIASTRKAHTKAQRHKGREGITKARKHEKDNRFDTKSSHKSAKAQRTGRESRKHENPKRDNRFETKSSAQKCKRETVFSVRFSAFNGKLNTEN